MLYEALMRTMFCMDFFIFLLFNFYYMFCLNKQTHSISKDKKVKDNNLTTIQCDYSFLCMASTPDGW